jgi:predicted NAD/FAD-dependent oxidoreductase
MTVVVVGAGLAGLACARVLVDAGHDVLVRERSRVVGGRFASQRLDGRPVDVGAAYFTVSDPDFAAVATGWQQESLALPWTTTFTVYDGSTVTSAAGPMRWAAPKGLRSLAEHLAADLPVRPAAPVMSVTGDPTVDGEPADAVALCMPGPQAERLLPGVFRPQSWDPVLSAVLRYPERAWPDFHGAFVNHHPVLTTVCDDGDRRGDRAPVLVAHSTDGIARTHLDDPAAAGPVIADAVGRLLGLPDRPSGIHVHRWGSARPSAPRDEDCEIVGRVGLAGDIFGTPRAQTAWLSGRALGGKLAALLS